MWLVILVIVGWTILLGVFVMWAAHYFMTFDTDSKEDKK